MFGFHAWDLLIVLLIALVIFGPRKLPKIGGAMGKSIRDFKKATNEIVDQVKAPEPQQLVSPSNQGASSEGKEALPAPAAPVGVWQRFLQKWAIWGSHTAESGLLSEIL